ncbi:phage tail length tape measure family protein [Mannheimia pernigra]|uniref:phage tail length tape measure family protein n=1 Tax=Mannheimia pernigra TaxID=111844 RepID=UPI001EE1B247|nr:phage tail length tape measure family protein [Mannheimia pernigra]
MTVEVGGVVITADLEFENLLRDTQKVDKAMDDIGKSTLKAEKGLKGLETQATKTAIAVNQATNKMKNIRGVAGQLGYQIQDISIMLQMGSNASTVIAQQGSQILSIFGPMGAVAGAILAISGAIGGALLPSLFDSTDATELLAAAQKNLSEVVTQTESGVSALSAKIIKLAKVSEDAAKAKIAVAMSDAKIAIKAAGDSSQKAFEQFDGFFGSFTNSSQSIRNAIDELKRYESKGKDVGAVIKELGGTYGGAIAEVNALDSVTSEMSKTLGITQSEALGLIKLLAQLEQDKSPDNIKLLAIALSDLSDKNGWANEELNKLTRTINDNSVSALDAETSVRLLESAIKDLQNAIQNSQGALDGNVAKMNQLADSAERKAATIGKTERETAKYAATLLATTDEAKKNLDSTLSRIDASYDQIEAYQAEQKALQDKKTADAKAAREAEVAAKKSAQAKKQVVEQLRQMATQYEIAVLRQKGMHLEAVKLEAGMRLGAAATKEQREEAEKLAQSIYGATAASQNFNAIQAQASPVTALDQRHQQQLAQIEEYKILYPQKIMEAEAARAAIEEQYRQQRMEAQWEEWKQASDGARMFGDAVDAVGSSATSTITGLLNGTMSVRDAFASIANTILSSVVQSLVEMGMAQVKQMIMGQAVAKASMAAQMVQAKALAAAFAPAASMVSLATQGANAVPAQAAITSTMGVAQMAAVTGRKVGGPVSANQMYRVGENNQPEIFKASNGMQYMIPGQGGRVFSNKQSQNRRGDESKHLTVVVNQTNHFSSDDVNSNQVGLAKLLGEQVKSAVRVELQTQMRAGGILSR